MTHPCITRGPTTAVHALSTRPEDVPRIAAETALPAGNTNINFVCKSKGGPRSGGMLVIRAGDKVIGSSRIPKTIVGVAGLGEHLDIGSHTGVPVISDYVSAQGRFTGEIAHVMLTYEAEEKEGAP